MIEKAEWQEAIKDKLLFTDIKEIEADFEFADAEIAEILDNPAQVE